MARRIIAGGVLIHQDKALIIKRAERQRIHPNRWELPSGRVESGEYVRDAALREFFEETGIKTRLAHPHPVRTDGYVIQTADGPRRYLQKIYLMHAEEPAVTLSNEHCSFRWVAPSELNDYNLLPGAKEDILAAFERRKKIAR